MEPSVYIVVLAAGQSSRFGSTKVLAPLDGKPLLQHVLTAAQNACPGTVCVVTGHSSDEVASCASTLADLLVPNQEYEAGIGPSIACGVRACRDRADAIIIMMADQPLVTASHLSDLIEKWAGRSGGIVATEFSGIHGPPVLFDRAFFDQLGELRGDAGAKHILLENSRAVHTVKFEAAASDIDTQADLQLLLNRR